MKVKYTELEENSEEELRRIPYRVIIIILEYVRIKIEVDELSEPSVTNMLLSPFCSLVSSISAVTGFFPNQEKSEDAIHLFFGYFSNDITRKIFFIFPSISLDCNHNLISGGYLPIKKLKHINFQRRTRSRYFGFLRDVPEPVFIPPKVVSHFVDLKSITGTFVLSIESYSQLVKKCEVRKITSIFEEIGPEQIRAVNELKDLKSLTFCVYNENNLVIDQTLPPIVNLESSYIVFNEETCVTLPRLKHLVILGHISSTPFINIPANKSLGSLFMYSCKLSSQLLESIVFSKSIEELIFWKCLLPDNIPKVFEMESIKRICLKNCYFRDFRFSDDIFFGDRVEVICIESENEPVILDRSIRNMLLVPKLKVLILRKCHLNDKNFDGCEELFKKELKIGINSNRISSSLVKKIQEKAQIIPKDIGWKTFFHYQ